MPSWQGRRYSWMCPRASHLGANICRVSLCLCTERCVARTFLRHGGYARLLPKMARVKIFSLCVPYATFRPGYRSVSFVVPRTTIPSQMSGCSRVPPICGLLSVRIAVASEVSRYQLIRTVLLWFPCRRVVTLPIEVKVHRGQHFL